MTIAVQELSKLLEPLMVAYHQTRKVINQQTGSALQYAIDDTRSQLESLFAPGFLSHVPWPWLAQYPRYLQAIQMRWQKITSGGSQKDRSAFGTIAPTGTAGNKPSNATPAEPTSTRSRRKFGG